MILMKINRKIIAQSYKGLSPDIKKMVDSSVDSIVKTKEKGGRL